MSIESILSTAQQAQNDILEGYNTEAVRLQKETRQALGTITQLRADKLVAFYQDNPAEQLMLSDLQDAMEVHITNTFRTAPPQTPAEQTLDYHFRGDDALLKILDTVTAHRPLTREELYPVLKVLYRMVQYGDTERGLSAVEQMFERCESDGDRLAIALYSDSAAPLGHKSKVLADFMGQFSIYNPEFTMEHNFARVFSILDVKPRLQIVLGHHSEQALNDFALAIAKTAATGVISDYIASGSGHRLSFEGPDNTGEFDFYVNPRHGKSTSQDSTFKGEGKTSRERAFSALTYLSQRQEFPPAWKPRPKKTFQPDI